MAERLGHWLRSVRPRTAADDDWPSSPEAADALAAIHRQIDVTAANGRAHRRRVPRRLWLPAGALATAAVIAFALASGGGPAGTNGRPPSADGPQLPAIRPAALLLSHYDSCEALLAGLRAHTAASVLPNGLPGQQNPYPFGLGEKTAGPIDGSAPMTPNPTDQIPAAQNPAAQNPATSTTNVEEAGVDEPDLVKTDGNRVLTITDGVLRVLDDSSRQVTGSLDLTMYEGWQNAQLLVSGDHALVILAGAYPAEPYAGPAALPALPAVGPSAALSTYLFVDLSGRPRITGSMRASGSYLDARRIGSTVRLVVSSAPTINFPAPRGTASASTAANRAMIDRAPLSAWLPQYSITTGSDTVRRTVSCDQVSHPARYTGSSMLTIYTLDLEHLGRDTAPVSVAADGDTVYATADSLYLASNPGWYCCQPRTSAQRTEIHRFDISGTARPTYLGSGSVPGRLLSQYSLSDYDGFLRIATTTGDAGSGGQSSSVYVLSAATLKAVGQVGGLGRSEQIYGVRFLGPLAYLVTFRQTDPLYVLDLRDPKAPTVVGTLQLTGYSDYLHDAGDGRLLGVGQEASRSGTVAGLQVSLFDVRKPAAPTRTGHVVLPDAPGEASLDPHAFLYWPPTGLVVVPVQSWAPTQSGKVLVLKVAGSSLRKVGLLANPRSSSAVDDGLGIQRSLIVDGVLWTVSGSGVQVSNPVTLARQDWIPFG